MGHRDLCRSFSFFLRLFVCFVCNASETKSLSLPSCTQAPPVLVQGLGLATRAQVKDTPLLEGPAWDQGPVLLDSQVQGQGHSSEPSHSPGKKHPMPLQVSSPPPALSQG